MLALELAASYFCNIAYMLFPIVQWMPLKKNTIALHLFQCLSHKATNAGKKASHNTLPSNSTNGISFENETTCDTGNCMKKPAGSFIRNPALSGV